MDEAHQSDEKAEISPPEQKGHGRQGGRKPNAKGRCRALREALKEKIQVGILRGDSPQVLIKALGIPQTTFYRYLQELADDTHEKRLAKAGQLIHAYFSRMEDTIRELDNRYGETRDTTILKQRADVCHAMFDRMQSAGFIPKRVDKQEVAHSGAIGLQELVDAARRDKGKE